MRKTPAKLRIRDSILVSVVANTLICSAAADLADNMPLVVAGMTQMLWLELA